jgi:hypothetical protein
VEFLEKMTVFHLVTNVKVIAIITTACTETYTEPVESSPRPPIMLHVPPIPSTFIGYPNERPISEKYSYVIFSILLMRGAIPPPPSTSSWCGA